MVCCKKAGFLAISTSPATGDLSPQLIWKTPRLDLNISSLEVPCNDVACDGENCGDMLLQSAARVFVGSYLVLVYLNDLVKFVDPDVSIKFFAHDCAVNPEMDRLDDQIKSNNNLRLVFTWCE